MRIVLLSLVLVGCATPNMPPSEWVVAPAVSVSNVSESPDKRKFLRAVAPAVRGGHRWGKWGVGASAETNFFSQENLDGNRDQFAALLVGVDGEVLAASGWIRSRVGAGLAVVLKGTNLDEPGKAGFYADLKPGGFRFVVGDAMRLTFDPISLAILLPDATGIPLIDVQYRSSLSLEFGL
jgi:hypothetical protein